MSWQAEETINASACGILPQASKCALLQVRWECSVLYRECDIRDEAAQIDSAEHRVESERSAYRDQRWARQEVCHGLSIKMISIHVDGRFLFVTDRRTDA